MEVDQTSASASKPGLSNTRLDPLSTNTVESMDIDYGPALPPRLDSHSRVDDASGINVSSVEEPSRLPSAQPKKSSHSFKQYVVAPKSASDHYSDHSDEPRPSPSRAKKHTDKSKLVFSKYPFWWDRVSMDFSGRVPGYSRRWAIIGDSTKISTFTNLKRFLYIQNTVVYCSVHKSGIT